MTQQTTQPIEAGTRVMSATDFDDSHYRTGQYLARIGKLWEPIAEEQQAIIDGQGYKHMNYDSWKEYWEKEWQESSGWSYGTVTQWLTARRNKGNTPLVGADQSTPLYDRLGPSHWLDLGSIEDPEERAEFLRRYEPEIKPKLKAEGVSSQIFREGIKAFKNERSGATPTVREVVSPEEMSNLPSGEFNKQQEFASKLPKTAASMDANTPEEIAQACIDLYPERIDWHIEWADKISTWAAQYRDELVAHQRQGIHAVK